ncbi:MAG: acetylxylan esterase [Planctomycetia bacterium]|nr:acetylxylan esterase [Planctomycetia bacterium]
MKLRPLFALMAVFSLLILFEGIVSAQDYSFQQYKNNKEKYGIPLKTLLQDTQKELGITITWNKKVEPYLEEKIPVAPWKLWADPSLRLAYFLAPVDLSFEKIDEKTYRIFEPWYYVRPESEAKAHLDRLQKLFPDRESWENRKIALKKSILEKLQLDPLPKKCDQAPIYTEKRIHDGYSVRNVALEILPGWYLCGSLYEPTEGKGPFPAILNPHGHGKKGRFGETQQIRSATLARMGAVCFTYSMFAWQDLESPLKREAHRDPISGSIQTLDSMRVLDFVSSLPNVDSNKIGITGASGGGTQTFLATALDPRIKVSVPVVMVSAHFYGGCPCESGNPFHITCGGTCNAEIAAMAAPRPMLIIAVTKDWTKNVPNVEFPYIQSIYNYYGAKNKVEFAYFDEEHGYSAAMRNAMYPFMAKHLGLDIKKADESKVVVEPDDALLVFGNDLAKYPKNGIKSLDELKILWNKIHQQK